MGSKVAHTSAGCLSPEASLRARSCSGAPGSTTPRPVSANQRAVFNLVPHVSAVVVLCRCCCCCGERAIGGRREGRRRTR
eukprot:scaffold82742_cov39-Phaeocystis_antarctica.AAC.1